MLYRPEKSVGGAKKGGVDAVGDQRVQADDEGRLVFFLGKQDLLEGQQGKENKYGNDDGSDEEPCIGVLHHFT